MSCCCHHWWHCTCNSGYWCPGCGRWYHRHHHHYCQPIIYPQPIHQPIPNLPHFDYTISSAVHQAHDYLAS